MLLVSQLENHPQVEISHEMFMRTNRTARSYETWTSERPLHRIGRRVAPPVTTARYLDWFFQPRTPDAAAVGFKVMYNQLRRHPELFVLLPRRDVRIVHLVRENLLKTELSAASAVARGVWTSRHDTAGDAKPPVELPVDGLVERLDRRAGLIETHRRRWQRRSPYLEVRYEDLAADREGTVGAITDFLGVERWTDPDLRFSKLNPERLEDSVANYDEVVAALTGTRFESFLDEPRAPRVR